MKLFNLRLSLFIVLILASFLSHAQTIEEILNAPLKGESVLSNGMGYHAQRFSPLKQITPKNAKDLVPVWSTSMASNLGEEAQPLVFNGVMYVTNFNSTVAINALTGQILWKHALELDSGVPRVICCGQVNRGPALFEGKVFRGTPDAHMLALDAKTGKELWRTKLMDWQDGYSVTGAPIVANGVVVTGMAGGEYGTRGFLAGFDPQTGKELWRHYNVPAPGEPGSETWPGDTADRGGATTWVAGSYDPELDLIYWGTGNAGPWNASMRKGDNKNASSVIAVNPKTGRLAWAFQFTPGDPFDFDSVSQMVLADIKVKGEMKKVLMHADKNGFLYVIDRSTGQIIAGNKYVKVTWAKGLDANGRPIWSESTTKLVETGQEVESWPANTGGMNWYPMSFSPKTGLLYANTLEGGMLIKHTGPVEYKTRGQRYIGVAIKKLWPEDGNRGWLRAMDPLTAKVKWQYPTQIPHWAGLTVTASDVLFTGNMQGEFMAFDALNGRKLWSFQTSSGITSQPITWSHQGRQYVTVVSGIGGVYAQNAGDERLNKVNPGGSVWTFALHKR